MNVDAGGVDSAQVLAQSSQQQGSHVPLRARGDSRRDRTRRIPEGHDPSLPATRFMCFQPTFPGSFFIFIFIFIYSTYDFD